MKKVLIVLVLVLSISFLTACGSDREETLNDWSSEEVTAENVQKIAKLALGVEKEIQVNISVAPEGGKAIAIQYNLGNPSDEKSAIDRATNDATFLFENMFKNSDITRVLLISTTDFIDQYGKESKGNAFGFKLNKDTAAKIQWSNFRSLVSKNPNNLINICEQYYINPAIQAKLDVKN